MQNTVGQTIRSCRDALGMKQNLLASRAGISAQYMNDIEGGSRIPPPETLRRLAEALEIDLPPLLWIWLRQQVGDDLADQMIAVYAGDNEPGGDDPVDHPYQRRSSWSHDSWCAVEGCTSKASAHRP